MTNDPNRKGSEPITPSQSSGGINPSSPTAGTEADSNPASFRPGAEGVGDLRFRCADVADPNCKWEARGRSEEELMPKIEEHGRQQHKMTKIDEQTRSKVRGAIRKAA